MDAELVRQRWADLCRWDPALPPDCEPAMAEPVIAALGTAFQRPQPLGWGLDPALEPVAGAFAVEVGAVGEALAQLVCLHEAFAQVVVDALPERERDEGRRRLDMIIQRTMIVAGEAVADHLVEDALTDPLTGIRNRRAFQVDLEREAARARRHRRPLTLAVVDLDGLKAVNDARGHAAGDDALRSMSRALRATARREDGTYRIGGDEFALLLVDAVVADEAVLVDRLRAAGAPPCSVGIAALVDDVESDLLAQADARLYELRKRARRPQASVDRSA
ncbi:MAG TPA: GGDEF domain-containing protein [Acidimicrobiales bacterium]|nr:GGDEF domain-containing protein [Acidimicrobiales bacterium]